MIVALTGFMGCGKSSVGRELSLLLSAPCIDLDKYIERKAGRRIPDIFAESGETAFRDLESEALYEVITGLGGFHSETSCSAGPPPSKLGSPPLTMPRVARFPNGNLQGPKNLIVSLGGGTILRPENAALIKERCTCIFLRATVETLRLHLGGEQSQRPLLRSGGFEALLAERAPLYTAAADFIIDIDNLSPMQVAGIIANLIT
jgi:shikimate kinase